MVLKTRKGDPDQINTFRTFFENEIRQFLERVQGVGSLFVFGGSEKQLEIVVSPRELAKYNLTFAEVMGRLATANTNVSAGVLGLQKKNYRVRTVSQFETPQDPLAVIIKDDGIRRVTLRDVAVSRLGYAPNDISVMHNGSPMIVCGVRKEKGSNVINLTHNIRKIVRHLNDTLLKENNLHFEIVYEQTPYINRAIDLVQNNVIIGSLLAIAVLLLFLCSISATLITTLAIPISVIGTFIFMWLLQRSLNVVSLAGISFAVGMLVDNAIVVLENIDRHRSMGKGAFRAAYEGTREVWGAVLASTTTTVAVFLPVIFMKEESGQLFKDIAIAITFAILLSLLVSVAVIPTLANQLFRLAPKRKKAIPALARAGGFLTDLLMWLSRMTLQSTAARLTTILLLTGTAVFTSLWLIPKAEYLPQGNRNLILNFLIPPPGYSLEKRKAMGDSIFRASRPYFETDGKDGVPKIKNLFYVAADRFTLFGATSVHETKAPKMIPLFTRIINAIPGVFGVSLQAGIFQNNISRGRTVDVNISGDDINRLIEVSRTLFGMIRQKVAQRVRPVPSIENSYPEANFIPNRSKLLASQITEQELGLLIDVIMDGRQIGEFKPEQTKKIDLVLRSDASQIQTPEDIAESMIANRFGKLVRIKDVARLKYEQGMMQINHLERRRNIKLEVTPPDDMPLQAAMEAIQKDIIQPLAKAGKLKGVLVRVGGNADKLAEALSVTMWNLIMAAAIVYLLMSALFENFFYPLFIMFSVPLAAAGGLIGLRLVNAYVAHQTFDIVTMLGFIILIGTVVNNAILIVHQSLNNVRYGNLQGIEAVVDSVRTRIRPIFMSTATSLFGMLPMILTTGAGSELYRGLGSVILGGLAVSTIFTIFLIPALLSFFIGFERSRNQDAET